MYAFASTRNQRVSPLAVLLTEKQHEQQQASPQLLVAEFQFER